MTVLPPIDTTEITPEDVDALSLSIREQMMAELHTLTAHARSKST